MCKNHIRITYLENQSLLIINCKNGNNETSKFASFDTKGCKIIEWIPSENDLYV